MSSSGESRESLIPTWRTLLALVGVNLLAIVVRMVFFSGLQGGDDAIYLSYAQNYAASGAIDPQPSHWSGRILVWLPIAAAMKLGCSAQVAFTWFPLACSLAALNALYWAARTRLGEPAAWYAGLLFAVFPLDVIYSTTSYCDGPCGSFAFLTLVCFLQQYESERPHLWGFLAGLCLAAGYLCRETVLIMALPLAIIALPRKHLVRAVWTGALGALVLLVAEVGFWKVETGDPLRRLHSTSESVAGIPKADAGMAGTNPGAEQTVRWWFPGPPGHPPYYHQNPFLDAAHSLFINEEYALFMIVGLPLLLWQLLRRDWLTWDYQVAFWVLLGLTLFFPFFGLKYTLRRDPRYCTLVIAPLCLCLAREISCWRKPLLRIGMIAVLMVTAVGGMIATQYSRTLPAFEELHEFRRLHAGTTIWAPADVAVMLAYRSSYDGDRDVKLGFLEGRRTSHRTQEYLRYRPDVPTLDNPLEAGDGQFVVISSRYSGQLPPEWKRVQSFGDRVPRLTRFAADCARGLGIPARIVNRLTPSHGRLFVYTREQSG